MLRKPHQEGMRVPGSILTFLLKLFFSSLRKQYKNDNIASFMYYGENGYDGYELLLN